MVTITLYARQQKRHRCIEQSFGLCGRGRGWDDLGEWHWNMYNIIYEKSRQSRFNAGYRKLGAGALGWPRGMVWGGRWEGGSGLGTHVHPWWIHVDVWQNQYNKYFLKRGRVSIVLRPLLKTLLQLLLYGHSCVSEWMLDPGEINQSDSPSLWFYIRKDNSRALSAVLAAWAERSQQELEKAAHGLDV